MVRNRLWMFIRKKTIRDYDCMNADTRQWEIGSVPGDNLEFSKETRSVLTKREEYSGAYIQQDLFPDVEYTNRWPSQFLDGLISIFSVPDPPIVVLDSFIWIPTSVLGIVISGLAHSAITSTHIRGGDFDTPNVSLDYFLFVAPRFWWIWSAPSLDWVCLRTEENDMNALLIEFFS